MDNMDNMAIMNTLIKRDNICVGYVEGGGKIRVAGECVRKLGNKKGDLYMSLSSSRRSILFVIGTDNRAYDLLNIDYNYEVLNNQTVYNDGEPYNGYLVTGTYNLGPLLELLGCDELLSIKKIKKICKTIFNYNFIVDNCHLFGVEPLTSEEIENYCGYSTFLSPAYQEGKAMATVLSPMHYGLEDTFYGVKGEGVLPLECFDILRAHRIPTVTEIISDKILGHYCSTYGHLRRNEFSPSKDEKKYTRKRTIGK